MSVKAVHLLAGAKMNTPLTVAIHFGPLPSLLTLRVNRVGPSKRFHPQARHAQRGGLAGTTSRPGGACHGNHQRRQRDRAF